MKIGELDMHCGNCQLINYCGDPFEYAICCARVLKDMEESEYIRLVEQSKVYNYETRFNEICDSLMSQR